MKLFYRTIPFTFEILRLECVDFGEWLGAKAQD